MSPATKKRRLSHENSAKGSPERKKQSPKRRQCIGFASVEDGPEQIGFSRLSPKPKEGAVSVSVTDSSKRVKQSPKRTSAADSALAKDLYERARRSPQQKRGAASASIENSLENEEQSSKRKKSGSPQTPSKTPRKQSLRRQYSLRSQKAASTSVLGVDIHPNPRAPAENSFGEVPASVINGVLERQAEHVAASNSVPMGEVKPDRISRKEKSSNTGLVTKQSKTEKTATLHSICAENPLPVGVVKPGQSPFPKQLHDVSEEDMRRATSLHSPNADEIPPGKSSERKRSSTPELRCGDSPKRDAEQGEPVEQEVKQQEGAKDEEKLFPNPPSAAATFEDKQKWQGFCEIENDPAFFNVMLEDFGVKGIRVREVFELDETTLALLPQPVYGFIFLFRYLEEDGLEESDISECPQHVWFANQTTPNACATVALLNIVNNIPDIDLGENLQSFKGFTKDFTPAIRGEQVMHFEFVKQIHNSFARKTDMLNIDLTMKRDAKRKPKPTTTKSKDLDEFNDAPFHFIAYVPIQGDVWKLDGLDRVPQKMGPYEGSEWLSQAAPMIQARMAGYLVDQIEFSLLAIVPDPVIGLRNELTANIKTLQTIDASLDTINSEWKAFQDTGENDALLLNEAPSFGITMDDVAQVSLPSSVDEKIAKLDDAFTLLDFRQKTALEQARVRRAFKDEDDALKADRRKAEERRHDYGPLIQTWLRILGEKGVLRDIIEEIEKVEKAAKTPIKGKPKRNNKD